MLPVDGGATFDVEATAMRGQFGYVCLVEISAKVPASCFVCVSIPWVPVEYALQQGLAKQYKKKAHEYS